MSKRLEDIFSVHRLRKAWSGDAPSPAGETDPNRNMTEALTSDAVSEPLVVFGELAGLVRQRFAGERGKALEPLLNDLEKKLELRFPAAPAPSLPEKERDALNLAIEALLIGLEDLAEALDLAWPR